MDLRSFARQGLGRRDRLIPTEIEHIALTVRRAPEVMIKVLPRGTQDLKSVQRHLAYIDRDGKVELETDEGEWLAGKDVEKGLLEDWDLDVDAYRRRTELAAANRREPPKLVHKLMFSMPLGTPPDKVLAAVRNFAREEFGLIHRYAMALHTDEPHPSVHMVVKAVSEQAVRLHIRKATLRDWRQEFARHLRAEGIVANASERVVRGVSQATKLDGIYRARLRGRSTHTRQRVERVVRELERGKLEVEPAKERMMATRRQVERGWLGILESLRASGPAEFADAIPEFLGTFQLPHIEKEWLAADIKVAMSRMREKRPEVLR